ncbi:UNVERIFIED_CONTAM: hypothetical protein GTU68_018034 [Idotea baltica]|nr:hypothetical protein [Idotea baltica]
MHSIQAKGILLDIEGTTSSISFVYDEMFPYVRDTLRSFLSENWDSPALPACLEALAGDVAQNQQTVAKAVIGLMDADVKATGLKELQGMIWKSGFQTGQLVAHLFDDVAECIQAWKASGLDVRIYSSGSIAAQKLFFGHSVAGDLLDQFSGHYDTTSGSKREAESYRAISQQFDCRPGQIVFISDVVEELAAAKEAGLQTALSVRPGNKPVPDNHGFLEIKSFAELEIC